MRIAATGAALVLTVASAITLYAESTATRRLEADVQAAERERDRLESEITVLRAERAFLTRPERIEPAARALGLVPTRPGQIIPADELASRIGGPGLAGQAPEAGR